MNKQVMFRKLLDIQALIFEGDDLMDQEVLFKLQDEISQLNLEVAQSFKGKSKLLNVSRLVQRFPYLYTTDKGEC